MLYVVHCIGHPRRRRCIHDNVMLPTLTRLLFPFSLCVMIARRAFDACGMLVLAETSLTLSIRIQMFVLVGNDLSADAQLGRHETVQGTHCWPEG